MGEDEKAGVGTSTRLGRACPKLFTVPPSLPHAGLQGEPRITPPGKSGRNSKGWAGRAAELPQDPLALGFCRAFRHNAHLAVLRGQAGVPGPEKDR